MVRYWCAQCNEEHDNARDCPAYTSLRGVKGPAAKNLKGYQKRQSKADYRAPKGSSNRPSDVGCVVVMAVAGTGLLGVAYAVAQLFA